MLDNDFFVNGKAKIVQDDLGIKLIEIVRELSRVPVIFCSTCCRESVFKKRVVSLNVNYCLTKPLDVGLLKNALKELELIK